MIVGSKAQTLHYSKDVVKAAKEPKELFMIEGENHLISMMILRDLVRKLLNSFGKYL